MEKVFLLHDVAWRGESRKEQVILHVDKLPLYFLCSFCLHFYKIVWWFYFNEISNCCVFATLPVYYFDQNLPASPLILPSPSIWNSRVNEKHLLNLFWFLICYVFWLGLGRQVSLIYRNSGPDGFYKNYS